MDSAEREGVPASNPSELKLATLNQAALEKMNLQDTVVDAIPTTEQNVTSKETKAGGDSTSPAANGK